VDNIPGIGMGRKTAAALIREFGGLGPLLANIDKVKSVRTREKLTSARDQILQNRTMVDLDCHLELPVAIDDLRVEPDYPGLIAALEKCEFKSLLQEVRDEAAKWRHRSSRNSVFRCSGGCPQPQILAPRMRRCVLPPVFTHFFRKKFERGPDAAVQFNRLRRFGRWHVFLDSLFLLSVCCPNLFFAFRSTTIAWRIFPPKT
jgi:5''-3'' exonuclease (including N-terminal domain of PolI)